MRPETTTGGAKAPLNEEALTSTVKLRPKEHAVKNRAPSSAAGGSKAGTRRGNAQSLELDHCTLKSLVSDRLQPKNCSSWPVWNPNTWKTKTKKRSVTKVCGAPVFCISCFVFQLSFVCINSALRICGEEIN